MFSVVWVPTSGSPTWQLEYYCRLEWRLYGKSQKLYHSGIWWLYGAVQLSFAHVWIIGIVSRSPSIQILMLVLTFCHWLITLWSLTRWWCVDIFNVSCDESSLSRWYVVLRSLTRQIVVKWLLLQFSPFGVCPGDVRWNSAIVALLVVVESFVNLHMLSYVSELTHLSFGVGPGRTWLSI